MSATTVTRQDGNLVFSGALDRAAAAQLWSSLQKQLDGVRQFDLSGVSRVDSAGLALLAELAARIGGVTVIGRPVGLDELRAAYRLEDNLAFAS